MRHPDGSGCRSLPMQIWSCTSDFNKVATKTRLLWETVGLVVTEGSLWHACQRAFVVLITVTKLYGYRNSLRLSRPPPPRRKPHSAGGLKPLARPSAADTSAHSRETSPPGEKDLNKHEFSIFWKKAERDPELCFGTTGGDESNETVRGRARYARYVFL